MMKQREEEARKKKLVELQQQLTVLQEELGSMQDQENVQVRPRSQTCIDDGEHCCNGRVF